MRVLCRGRLRLKSANFLLEAGKLMSDSVMSFGVSRVRFVSQKSDLHRPVMQKWLVFMTEMIICNLFL